MRLEKLGAMPDESSMKMDSMMMSKQAAMHKTRDLECESREYFKSEAVKGISMQVGRKQAAVRSKRAMF